jgi:hypothetical protein
LIDIYRLAIIAAKSEPVLLRLLFIICVLAYLPVMAQNSITIRKASAPIKLDGVLDDPDWQNTDVATNFRQYFPYDSSLANAQTEIRLTYDENFIYIGAKMFNLGPRKYVTPSLRRDYRGEANDGVTVVFDTFKDRTNAFSFGVNPFGVQREGLVANGGSIGRDDFTLNWDNKWYSEAKI